MRKQVRNKGFQAMPYQPDKPKSIPHEEANQVESLISRLKKLSPHSRRYAVQRLLVSLGGPGFTQGGHPTRGRRKIDFKPLWEKHCQRLHNGEACELISHEAKALRQYQSEVLGESYPLSVNSIRMRLLKRHGDHVNAQRYTQIVEFHRQL